MKPPIQKYELGCALFRVIFPLQAPLARKGEEKKLYVPPQARSGNECQPKLDKGPSVPSSKSKPTTKEQGKSEELQSSKVANSKREAAAQKSAPRSRANAPRTHNHHPRPHPHDNRRRDYKPRPPRDGRVHLSRDKPGLLDTPGQGTAEVAQPLDPTTSLANN